MLSCVAIIALCFGAGQAALCGRSNPLVPDNFDKIVGGQAADRGEYPWQISLQRSAWGISWHICGASILDATTVITAAHCVEGSNASTVLVLAGEHVLNYNEGSEQTVNVSKIHVHSKYNSRNYENDIAILKLSSSLNLDSQYISPICLPTRLQEHSGYCTVTGWGALHEGGIAPSILQEVSVPVITDAKCRQNYSYTAIMDSMVCAGYDQGGKDACKQDSGGPFVCQNDSGDYVLAGIVSWGLGCGREGKPGVYTQVSHYLDWIDLYRA